MASSAGYFIDYEESTLDPGWSLVLGSLMACTILHLTLPCIVSLGCRYERRWNETTSGKSANSQQSEDSSMGRGETLTRAHDVRRSLTGKSGSPEKYKLSQNHVGTTRPIPQEGGRTELAVVKEDEQLSTSTKSSSIDDFVEDYNAGAESTIAGDCASEGFFSWFCGIADALVIPPNNNDEMGSTSSHTSKKDNSIVFSIGSFMSTATANSNSSAFRGRPARQPGLKRNTSNIHSIIQSGGSTNETQNSVSAAASQIPPPSQPGSVMSCLHYDDVSFNEAIDSYSPTQYLLPNDEKAGEVDILFGENAWWKPGMMAGGLDRIIGVAEYDAEFSQLVQSALPFSFQSSVAGLFNVVDIALVSHFWGGSETSAFVVVPLLTWITNTMNYGFCEALGRTIPLTMGRAHGEQAGKYLNTSLSLYTLGLVPTAIIWSLATRRIFLWFGFDEATADLAQEYAYVQLLLEWITGIEYCIHLFLDLVGHEKYSTYTMFAQTLGQTLGIIVPLLSGTKDLLLVGFCRVAISGVLMFGNTCIVLYYGWVDSFARGLLVLPFTDWEVVRTIGSRAGILGVAYFLTYGQWEILAFFASSLGPAELVAWGILGHIWSTMKFVSDGIADAAEIRSTLHLVSNRPEVARLSAYKSLFLGFVSSILVTSILFMLGEEIALLVTPNATLQRLMIEVFPLIGIGHVVMTSGIISWALLGAQGRYNLATMIHFAGNWGLTLPLSCIFTFALGIDLQGLATAVVMGLAIAGVGNLYVLIRSRWGQIATNLVQGAALNVDDMDQSTVVPSIKRPVIVSPTTVHNSSARRNIASFDASPRIQQAASRDDGSVAMSSVTGYSF